MGTEYRIIEQNGNTLACDEMSSRFDIEIFSPMGACASLQRLTPEQLALIGVEFLKIASYNMDKEELEVAINAAIEQGGGYKIGVMV